jgi:hypothetical protein
VGESLPNILKALGLIPSEIEKRREEKRRQDKTRQDKTRQDKREWPLWKVYWTRTTEI